MALTATAKKVVVNDIITKLGMKGCVRLTSPFNRPNLYYRVLPKPSAKTFLSEMSTWLRTKHPDESGVIYCFSRNNCEQVARDLREKHGLKTGFYHAGMSVAEKEAAQSAWQRGEVHIIVATVCFTGCDFAMTFLLTPVR
jgi:superfamily II DNA helicase RecQ